MALTQTQRDHLADKLMDSANVLLVSLVIAGVVEPDVPRWLAVAGALLYFTLLLITTRMRRGG